jgi:flagellar hook-associated protein 2
LRDKINALNVGVTARTLEVSDGSFRLFLESDQTGVDSEITVVDDLFDIAANQTQQGLDAQITYNGVAISRSSNQVSDVIEGVNLSLTSTTESSFVIDVYQNTQASQKSVLSLVDAFNQFNQTMKTLTATASEDSAGGDFAGDSIVRDIQRKMRSFFIDSGSVTGDNITRMSDMGVSIDRNGVFQVDQAKLSSALINHYGEVKSFFTANTDQQSIYDVSAKGLAGDVLTQINEYLKYDGLVSRYELSNARTAAALVSEEKELDTQMTAYEERYVKQFSAMNAAIAEMNSLKDYLDSQLNNMPFTAKKD